jgi:hypothetical protein
MKTKSELLLKKLNEVVSGKEKEFLLFMQEPQRSQDQEVLSLLDEFILFEEVNSDEEFTEEAMTQVLSIYVPAFEKGEHIF